MINGTAVQRLGPKAAPAVVLIHGLGLNRDCWQWTTPALLAAGYQVIAYDLYGHGQSDPPPETPSLTLFSHQLLAVLDHFGIQKAAITGFSLGGMIARHFAQEHLDRTTAIAILHSPHRRTPEAQQAIVARVVQARLDGPAATIEAALERWFTQTFRQAHPETMALVRSWVLANDRAIYHTVYRVLVDGIDEITATQPPISCPAMVMTGDEDYGNGPEMSQAIAAEIPGAEIHILRGLRHMALAEKPDAVNTPLVAFLNTMISRGNAA
ncbi:alpha/beta fold hydrolase [Pseudorhodobacter turbinis]|uniref:Alpha/beta fold hydrolase n=1 Tax=Pseudorhodobacter turbinis TaxID=2500533 RepID=A0A4P8EEI6_9RHOB|nr:alpha/beta hydrolase [Pseudorhodobacter turbinis]QCO55471.1 alpha/beta fold hydrolase [Pseudorhodobacter turbinis]